MLETILQDNWKMKTCGTENEYPAVVPGSVYNDLLLNGLMEDPYYRDNEIKALALMEEDYQYRTVFSVDEAYFSMDEVLLCFEGLDTVADIYLNGEKLDSVCNMHREWQYPVLSLIRKDENELKIIFHSPTQYIKEMYEKDPVEGMADAMVGFPNIRKAHCMFGWDWGPRLPDAGIWRKVRLLGVKKAKFASFYVTQEHLEDRVKLRFQSKIRIAGDHREFKLEVNSPGDKKEVTSYNEIQNNGYTCSDSQYAVRVTVTSPEGIVIQKGVVNPEEIEIADPKIWWPNGYGEQPLYEIKAELLYEDVVCDVWEKKIGLRSITIHMEKDEFGEQFAHEVNGVKIFAMGADYIPEDNILARVNRERTRTLLEHCAQSHFNCIRIWGGGHYPEDYFFDICDELGIIVWQDFMFAGAVYHLTEDFEKNVAKEIVDNVRRLRHHASLGLWCGNNEMEMFMAVGEWGSGFAQKADYIKMYEYLFPQILEEEDPQTFYWKASPSSGGGFDNPNDETRGDAHYWDVWHGNKPFTEFRKFKFRYLSEFGFQSFPSIKTIESFTKEEDRNVFSYVMEKHQRHASANGRIMNYMEQTFLYPNDFDTLIYASQILQAEAIRYGVEHFRRHRGCCMGTIYWQLNDCWPVASWASIDYFGRWKALQYYAKRFFAPLMISCQEEGMLSLETNINKENFKVRKSIRLNVANETLKDCDVTVEWHLRNAASEILREEEVELMSIAQSATWLSEVDLEEADLFQDYVSYQLCQEGQVISEGTVLFCPPKYYQFRNPKLSARIEGDEIIVSASSYAKCVEVRNKEDNLLLSDNFFDMNAGEKRIKILKGNPEDIAVRSIYNIR